jgi:hypothetical protein
LQISLPGLGAGYQYTWGKQTQNGQNYQKHLKKNEIHHILDEDYL